MSYNIAHLRKLKRACTPQKTLSHSAVTILIYLLQELKNNQILIVSYCDLRQITGLTRENNRLAINQLKNILTINFHDKVEIGNRNYLYSYIIIANESTYLPLDSNQKKPTISKSKVAMFSFRGRNEK